MFTVDKSGITQNEFLRAGKLISPSISQVFLPIYVHSLLDIPNVED
jgi:hypothetical protein